MYKVQMVQVVVLSANGESRTMKTMAFAAGGANGDLVAKALRKKKAADIIGTYTYKEQTLTVWGWAEGKAGTENKHELPPLSNGNESALLFGDIMVTAPTDFTSEKWAAFYEDAFGGFEDIGSESEGDEDEADEAEEEEEADEVEEAEVDGDGDGDADEDDDEEDEEEAEEAEEEGEADEEEDVDDDCYDDGDENGGGGKRRAPRRRTIASPEYRRIDMGLRSRVKLPAPLGKRAPKWQTAQELETEEYDL